MALDTRLAQDMALLEDPGSQPTLPISPTSPGLVRDSIPQQKSEAARAPSAPSDDSDSHVEDTIVCAPFARNLRTPRQQTHAKRRTTFDKVFQGGNAPIKHFIVQVPASHGSWYILHCEEHQQAFSHPALRGAARHLQGKKHGLSRYPTNLEVVKHLGVEVLGCSPELAEKNNSVVLKARRVTKKRSAEDITEEESRPREETNQKTASKRRFKQRRFSGATRPIPGRVYLAYWEKTRDWLPALVLPHIGLEAFGIPSTLEKLGLMDRTPACYECDPDTKDLKWQQGYELDGPRSMERAFPVMFFSSRDFPRGAPVGWVRASDLQELNVFEASSRLMPSLKFVKKYLRKRLQQDVDSPESSVDSLDEEDDSEPRSPRSTDNEGPSNHLVPDQPKTKITKDGPDRLEAPPTESAQPGVLLSSPKPTNPSQSRRASSPEPQVESTPRKLDAQSLVENITVISISSSEDKQAHRDGPAMPDEPPATDEMELDNDHSTATEEEGTTRSTQAFQTPTHSPEQKSTAKAPRTGGALNSKVSRESNQKNNTQIQVPPPSPIHVQHIQHILPSLATINLRNLMQRSTHIEFPGALPNSVTQRAQLPPMYIPTNKPQSTILNSQGHPTLNLNHLRLPSFRDLESCSSLHVNSSASEISSRPPTSTATPSQALQPPQPQEPPEPPPSNIQAHSPASPSSPASPYQAPPPKSDNPLPRNYTPPHRYRPLELETVDPRLGRLPNEVPPAFLDRLRRLVGTRDKYPRMSKFRDEGGLFCCPWCQKRYGRAVRFTDHLVLNHSRSGDPRPYTAGEVIVID